MAASAANEVLAARLLTLAEYGWAVTCLFYSALHLVEAYLVQQGLMSGTHRERHVRMLREPNLVSLRSTYNLLKQESELARYECQIFSAEHAARVRQLLYSPVATGMRDLLGVT